MLCCLGSHAVLPSMSASRLMSTQYWHCHLLPQQRHNYHLTKACEEPQVSQRIPLRSHECCYAACCCTISQEAASCLCIKWLVGDWVPLLLFLAAHFAYLLFLGLSMAVKHIMYSFKLPTTLADMQMGCIIAQTWTAYQLHVPPCPCIPLQTL